MDKWEYLSVLFPGDGLVVVCKVPDGTTEHTNLNILGRLGWELVSISVQHTLADKYSNDDSDYNINSTMKGILKRRLKD